MCNLDDAELPNITRELLLSSGFDHEYCDFLLSNQIINDLNNSDFLNQFITDGLVDHIKLFNYTNLEVSKKFEELRSFVIRNEIYDLKCLFNYKNSYVGQVRDNYLKYKKEYIDDYHNINDYIYSLRLAKQEKSYDEILDIINRREKTEREKSLTNLFTSLKNATNDPLYLLPKQDSLSQTTNHQRLHKNFGCLIV